METVYWTCEACGRESHIKTLRDNMTEGKCIHCRFTTQVIGQTFGGEHLHQGNYHATKARHHSHKYIGKW